MGGSLFYLLVLTPSFKSTIRAPIHMNDERHAQVNISIAFGNVVKVAIGLFIVTGALLTVDRLSQPGITAAYVVALALHVTCASGMFWLATKPRRTAKELRGHRSVPASRRFTRHHVILTLGLLAYGTAIVLKVVFEQIISTGA